MYSCSCHNRIEITGSNLCERDGKNVDGEAAKWPQCIHSCQAPIGVEVGNLEWYVDPPLSTDGGFSIFIIINKLNHSTKIKKCTTYYILIIIISIKFSIKLGVSPSFERKI